MMTPHISLTHLDQYSGLSWKSVLGWNADPDQNTEIQVSVRKPLSAGTLISIGMMMKIN